jgi:ABC-type nitrate/sulfonate/bicarbonate transport system permease component
MKFKKDFFKPFIIPFILLCLWELLVHNHEILKFAYRFLGYSPEKIPDFSFVISLSDISSALYSLLLKAELYSAIGSTIKVLIVSFMLAMLIGIIGGFLIGLYKNSEIYFISTIDALRSIPPIVLLPLFLLFLGVENQMKIAFVLFGGIWPILLNTYFGVKNIDPVYLKVAKNLQLKKSKKIFKVILPLASPAIFTGIKIALSLCLILTIVCEMMIGNKGIGFLINYAKRNMDYPEMYACIFLVAIMGFLINKLLKYVDNRFLYWYYQSQK